MYQNTTNHQNITECLCRHYMATENQLICVSEICGKIQRTRSGSGSGSGKLNTGSSYLLRVQCYLYDSDLSAQSINVSLQSEIKLSSTDPDDICFKLFAPEVSFQLNTLDTVVKFILTDINLSFSIFSSFDIFILLLFGVLFGQRRS